MVILTHHRLAVYMLGQSAGTSVQLQNSLIEKL